MYIRKGKKNLDNRTSKMMTKTNHCCHERDPKREEEKLKKSIKKKRKDS